MDRGFMQVAKKHGDREEYNKISHKKEKKNTIRYIL